LIKHVQMEFPLSKIYAERKCKSRIEIMVVRTED